jgi:hypothetical protein
MKTRFKPLVPVAILAGLLLTATACSDSSSAAGAPGSQSATQPVSAPTDAPSSTSEGTPTDPPSADPTGTPGDDPTGAATPEDGDTGRGSVGYFCKEYKASDASVLDPAADKAQPEERRMELATQVQNLAADAPTDLIPPMQVLTKYYPSIAAGTFNHSDADAEKEFSTAKQVVGDFVHTSCNAG